MTRLAPLVVIRGGGDLATGVAARLVRAGFAVAVTELQQPLVIRRTVALAEAVFRGETAVEDLTARRVGSPARAREEIARGIIPVLIDPEAESLSELCPVVALVDARMRKQPNELGCRAATLVVGLGPGFIAGEDCHAVIETKRGHRMGRVIWKGPAEADTRSPEAVGGQAGRRVLRAPADGRVDPREEIGARLTEGQLVAEVAGYEVRAPFAGVLRGLIHPEIPVTTGMKIGDVDPRGEAAYCWEISDKSLAIGGGVLEALLSRRDIRRSLGEQASAAG
jgi:xanthine dehydrogenase accessory factor